MASTSAEQWKAKGNDHFAASRFNDAVGCYSKAIEAHSANPAEGKLAVYFANRSAAYFRLKQLANALEDANKACQADSTWPKAFMRQSAAFSALGRPREALRSILTARGLSGSSPDPSIQEEVSTCWSSYITDYFRLHTRSLHVEVRWIDEQMGRGVFNVKEGTTDDNLIVFREKPLLSHIQPGSRQACAHCLRTKLSADDLKPHYENQHPFVYPNQEGPHSWFSCENCSESYCTESCRGLASQKYHKLLCKKSTWWTEAHQADPVPHPMETIENLCLEAQPSLINPMLIARMLSGIVNHIASHNGTQQSIDEALEPYKLFSSGEKANDRIANVTLVCVRALYHCKYHGQPEILKILDSVVTEALYHELHGIISRNAHHLNPLSDFHIYLEGLNQLNQHLLVAHYSESITPMEFVQSEWMKNLTVQGTGLFEVANSINHSCDPNCMVVHCDIDHTISIVTKKDITHGSEITISYIDESLPKAERQAKLKQFYNFDCKCTKCQSEP
jgi:tetratricopeptide (TPR) repeat protein